MKHKTRKLIFTALAAILVSLLFTCIPGPPDYEDFVLPEFTDVEYSPDGGSVTIYLDGSAPVRSSRALNFELAKLGHDLFEVAFMSGTTVARAVWETGHAAGVSGVARDVDYTSAVPGGAGSAILFVGKKSDRTLLAVGRLTHVNNGAGNVETALVTADTRSVTFTVAALKAGVSDDRYASSFTTNARTQPIVIDDSTVSADNTYVTPVTIGEKDFPLFNLDPAPSGTKTISARYRFEVASGSVAVPGLLNSTYVGGILRGGSMRITQATDYPSSIEPKFGYGIPRYPIGDGETENWATSADSITGIPIDVDLVTLSTVTPANNNGSVASNPAFENPARFTFNSNVVHDKEAFAFSFQIPVYPLTNIDNRRTTGFMWYIRPGYDSYWLDLDDGLGNGGSILIGTGQFTESVTHSLSVKKKPEKTRYNGTGTDPWQFDLTGIVVYVNAGTLPRVVGTDELYFIIDRDPTEPGVGGTLVGGPGVSPPLPNDFRNLLMGSASTNGIVRVYVEYYGAPEVRQPDDPIGTLPYNPDGSSNYTAWRASGGGVPLWTYFELYYIVLPAGFTTPDQDTARFVIVNQENANALNVLLNAIPSGGSCLLVFMDSFDLGGVVLNNSILVIVIAGKEGIVLGKTAAAGTNGAINHNGTTSTYYLGVWPFDEILSVQGTAINSQLFYINPAGSHTNVDKEDFTIINNGAQMGGTFISGTGAGAANLNAAGVIKVPAGSNIRPGGP
jgi:hypothetical protein